MVVLGWILFHFLPSFHYRWVFLFSSSFSFIYFLFIFICFDNTGNFSSSRKGSVSSSCNVLMVFYVSLFCHFSLSLSFLGVPYLHWFWFGDNLFLFSCLPNCSLTYFLSSSVSCLWVLLSFSSFILFCSSMDFYLFLIGELWLFV